MAIAFARVSIHSRSKGHSAVAGAAYRAGKNLFDERTGETHDYSKRGDVHFSEIMLPDGGGERFLDRETLWNEVERMEKRSDSQVAKDVILALPRELPLSQQIELARNFADYHFVSKGLVADVNIHQHENDEDEDDDGGEGTGRGNPHAHIFITTRRLIGDAFDKHKARDLNPDFNKGRVASQDYWGEQWRTFQNDYFERHKLDLRVDEKHLITQQHEGHVHAGGHYIKESNALKRESSRHIVLKDPDNLINQISTRYTVFTEKEIDSLLLIHTNTPDEFTFAKAQLLNNRDILPVGFNDEGVAHFTTRANLKKENRLLSNTQAMANTRSHYTGKRLVKAVIKRQSLTIEQQEAVFHLTQRGGCSVLVGGPKSGKTHSLKVATMAWEKAGYEVLGLSFAGAAVKKLQRETGITSMTTASLLLRLEKKNLTLTSKHVLVLDGASTTDLHSLDKIVKRVKNARAKLILVDDEKALQPVLAGGPLRAITEVSSPYVLSSTHGQESAGDRQASKDVADGRILAALEHYRSQGQIHFVADESELDENSLEPTDHLIAHWASEQSSVDRQQQLIIAYRNDDIDALNQKAHDYLLAHRRLKRQHITVLTEFEHSANGGWDREQEIRAVQLHAGERVMFKKTEKSMNVVGGEFAEIIDIQRKRIILRKDDGDIIDIDSKEYRGLSYGYASNVFKAHSATVDNTYVYFGHYGWDKHLIRTALTRHHKKMACFVRESVFANVGTLAKACSRERLNDNVIDWPYAFALRHGFDEERQANRLLSRLEIRAERVIDKWYLLTNAERYTQRARARQIVKDYHARDSQAAQLAEFTESFQALNQRPEFASADLNASIRTPLPKKSMQQLERTAQLASSIAPFACDYDIELKKAGISRKQHQKLTATHKRLLLTKRFVDSAASPSTVLSTEETLVRAKQAGMSYQEVAYFAKEKNINPDIVWAKASKPVATTTPILKSVIPLVVDTEIATPQIPALPLLAPVSTPAILPEPDEFIQNATPELILYALRQCDHIVTEKDITKIATAVLGKSAETELDATLASVFEHPSLIKLGIGLSGVARYTTLDAASKEWETTRLTDKLQTRFSHKVPQTTIDSIIAQSTLNPGQQGALSHLLNTEDLSLLVGRAGTGKSYLMRYANLAWRETGFDVIGCALAGVAAKSLQRDSGIRAATIATLLKKLNRSPELLTKNSVLVVDEAGMVARNELLELFQHTTRANAKLVLIGDSEQLQPIEAGRAFKGLIDYAGAFELSTILRQQSEGDRLATSHLAEGRVSDAIAHYQAKDAVHLHDSSEAYLDGVIENWREPLAAGELSEQLMLAFTNKDVDTLNRRAHEWLVSKEFLTGEKNSIYTQKGHPLDIRINERLLCLGNTLSGALKNGDFLTVTAIDKDFLHVRTSTDEDVSLPLSGLPPLSYGYAATVHKSQGMSVDNVTVAVSGYGWNRHLTYVAMSRHRHNCTVMINGEDYASIEAATQQMSFAPLSDTALDYPKPALLDTQTHDAHLGEYLQSVNHDAHEMRARHHNRVCELNARQDELITLNAFLTELKANRRAIAQLSEQTNKESITLFEHVAWPELQHEKIALQARAHSYVHAGLESVSDTLSLNRVERNTLLKASKHHEHYLTHLDFINAYQSRHADSLTSAALSLDTCKLHFGYLHHAMQARNMPVTQSGNVLTHFRESLIDAKAQLTLSALSTKNDKKAFQLTHKLVTQQLAMNTHWKDIFALGGFDKASKESLQLAFSCRDALDKLAHDVSSNPQAMGYLTSIFERSIGDFVPHIERTSRRLFASTFTDTKALMRDEIADTLINDRRYYQAIQAESLDWKELKVSAQRHRIRKAAQKLPESERPYFYRVARYQQLRTKCGKLWSAYYEDKNNVTIKEQAIHALQQRNKLASQLHADIERYTSYLKDLHCKVTHIEEHAMRFSEAERHTHKPPRTTFQRKTRPVENTFNREPRLDANVVNDALAHMAESFYEHVLGEPSNRHGHSWRFGAKGSLSVTLTGAKAGRWYSFESGQGGNPISLLMDSTDGLGLPFKEALEYGASFAGVRPEIPHPTPVRTRKATDKKHRLSEEKERSERISRAQYYVANGKNIRGSVAERYLREHRGITCSLDALQYHNEVRDIFNRDSKVTYPAVLVSARDAHGSVTACHTILLDAKSAKKASVEKAKISRGVVKGAAALIHQGRDNNVILCEGIETGLSIASSDPSATVYATLGNFANAKELAWIAEKHKTQRITFAMDNDGENKANITAMKKAAEHYQNQSDITVNYVMPPQKNPSVKRDFNDVLLENGPGGVLKILNNRSPVIENQSPEKNNTIEPNDNLISWCDKSFDSAWQILAVSKDPHAEMMLETKQLIEKGFDPSATKIIESNMNSLARKASKNKALMGTLEKESPSFVHKILKVVDKSKERNKTIRREDDFGD